MILCTLFSYCLLYLFYLATLLSFPVLFSLLKLVEVVEYKNSCFSKPPHLPQGVTAFTRFIIIIIHTYYYTSI